MPTGPDPAHLTDPRFEQVFLKALKRQGLAPQLGEPVRQLVGGTADPRQFVCCDTGCMPCVKDYLRAAEEVLRTLGEPGGGAAAKRPWWAFWRR